MADSRIYALSHYLQEKWPLKKKLTFFLGSVLVAFMGSRILIDAHAMPQQANGLFILILASLLWITEAIPSFAVSFLVLGFSIYLLDDLNPTTINPEWKEYTAQWSSTVMWLFLGGFILAEGAHKTGFDRYFSRLVLSFFGTHPAWVLFGVMLTTGVLSMFISNTATAVMMLSVVQPVIARLQTNNPYRKGLLLGIAIAATVSGMGTIIGSAPNAIAVGNLAEQGIHVSFTEWMIVGVPVSLLLLFLGWILLLKFYPSTEHYVEVKQEKPDTRTSTFRIVTITFFVTVFLWMSSGAHGIPVPVIAFIPIIVLTVTGILGAKDMRKVPWDTLILIVGGLILGDVIRKSDLATLFITVFPQFDQPFLVLLLLGLATSGLSNLMSNTATAGIIIPLVALMLPNHPIEASVIVGLSCSTALLLPISTPPNSVVYSSGTLSIKDFRLVGMIIGLLGVIAITVLTFVVY